MKMINNLLKKIKNYIYNFFQKYPEYVHYKEGSISIYVINYDSYQYKLIDKKIINNKKVLVLAEIKDNTFSYTRNISILPLNVYDYAYFIKKINMKIKYLEDESYDLSIKKIIIKIIND